MEFTEEANHLVYEREIGGRRKLEKEQETCDMEQCN